MQFDRSTPASLRRSVLVVLALVALILGACAGVESSAPESMEPSRVEMQEGATAAQDDEPGFPVRVDDVEIASRPQRIVSLSSTATEMLFAIGAGSQVVAADEYSNYPGDAPTTDLSGFQPNVEAISAFDPDLVVASGDPGELAASLEALGIPTLMLPSAVTLDDTYAQIEQLGVATGHIDRAAATVASMQTEIEEILAGLDLPDDELTFFHELTPDYYSVTSDTFIGDVYGLFGMRSIADAAGNGGAYPQLSPEYIIEADPDLILLADAACCGVTAEEVSARPGWETISAVQQGLIVELDEDIASRWGPRVVDFVREVGAALQMLEPAAG